MWICVFPLENSGRKAREEKPGSFETERGERTRGEDGQTVSGTWELACEVWKYHIPCT